MYDFIFRELRRDYVGEENEFEFFEKINLDNENFDSTIEIEVSPEIEISPSFYTANVRKKRGYRRTVAKNRFRGQRDGNFSFAHENRAYNRLCKEDSSERCSSIIKRGYFDYLDDIEEEKKACEAEKNKKIWKESYKNSLIEERADAVLTIQILKKQIAMIDEELAKLDLE